MPLVSFAVFLLEFVNSLLIFIGLLALNYVIFGFLEIADPGLFLWGFFLSLASGGAFAFLLSVLSRISLVVPKSAPIILRPLFYISGVFYIANELPPRLLSLISWNPLFHSIELLREGMFEGYSSVLAQGWVPLAFISGCLLVGMAVLSVGRLPFGATAQEEVA